MSTDKKLIQNIINEIEDLEKALERFECFEVNKFLEDSHIKKIATQTLINISESIEYITMEIKANQDEIDWKQFKTIRNIAAHKYGAINFYIVWQIININLPVFKKQLQEFRRNMN